jgi:DNA primase
MGNKRTAQHIDRSNGPAPSTTRTSAFAVALWDAALPLPGTIAEIYLATRGLAGIQSAALRYLPRTPHPGCGARLPAMLAAIRDTMTGELRAVHRTYLRGDGAGKAEIDPARASLGPVAGGAVMLDDLREGEALVIGEGIESVLSAAVMIGGVAWSAVFAGNLAKLPLPLLPAGMMVVIAADPDAAGHRAADDAARRWRGEGRTVRIATPDAAGSDFNDLLRAKLATRKASHG